MLLEKIRNFSRKIAGNVAVTFSLGAVALFAAGGAAIDYSKQIKAKSGLQAAVDSAATAAVRELQLLGANTAKIKAVAASYVKAGAKDTSGTLKTDTTVDPQNGTVTVKVSVSVKTPFFNLAGLSSTSTVNASARARILGGLPLCVLALETTDPKSIAAYSKAKITATGCSMYTNSTSSTAIEAWGNSLLNTGMTCSAGGAEGGSSNYSPAAVTDCPAVPDPLKDRIAPTIGACDYNNFEANSGSVTLVPGTYCGGLAIHGSAKANFLPGVYIVKDGLFEATLNTTLTGTDVGFYFTGTDAKISFTGKTSISFTGRETGDMAGLLFFEDPAQSANQTHQITSPNVSRLEGTIYLPKGTLFITSKDPASVAGSSAYTVLITRFLLLTSSANLILNTDYASSQVPVPTTISRLSGDIVLDR